MSSEAAAIIHRLIVERSRTGWLLVLVNVIFSSTFLTIFAIALIVNKDLQRIVLLVLSLIGSSIFLSVRLLIGTYHLVRIILNLAAFVAVRAFAKAVNFFQCARYNFNQDPRERLLIDLDYATTFKEWKVAAEKLDEVSGGTKWREEEESELYEWKALSVHVSKLRMARTKKDLQQLMFLLQLSCSRTFCGISNAQLYSRAFSGTKCLIEDFTTEVCLAIEVIANAKQLNEVEEPRREHPIVTDKNSSPSSSANTRDRGALYSTLMHHSIRQPLDETKTWDGLDKTRFIYRESCIVSVQDRATQTTTGVMEEVEEEVCSLKGIVGRHHQDSDINRQIYCNSMGIPLEGCSPTVATLNVGDFPFLSAENGFSPRFHRSSPRSADHGLVVDSGPSPKSPIKDHLKIDLQPIPERASLSSAQSDSNLRRTEDALKFLLPLRLSWGSTALCLSGGGALAMYHMGVARTLLEHNCLPKIISGTSGGAIVAAVLAICTDEELLTQAIVPEIINRHVGVRWFPPVSAQLQRFFLKGHMMDGKDFAHTCQCYFRSYTFKDAFMRTGRLVSIAVTPATRSCGNEALVLNHINTPNVFIWSAVAASCSLPGLLPPHELMVRSTNGSPVPYCHPGLKWIDGSISQDIPVKELSRVFNVKQFIVSQVNPHHAPFVKNRSLAFPWLQSVENWLVGDIKNRYAKLAERNFIPRIFGHDISAFWMVQVFEGNVTITPPASLIDWYRMINQPSVDDMADFITKGQQRTWPHLSRIAQMLKIEQVLQECWTGCVHTVRSASAK